MEQKKILWVILTITGFVVIVFGIALWLYSPSRANNRSTINQLSDAKLDTPNRASIDPDAWVQNDDSIPSPENENAPVSINNNVTIVTGSDDSVGLDISGLDENSTKVDGTLPDEIAKDIIPIESNSKKEDGNQGLTENTTTDKTETKTVAETTKPVTTGVKKIVANKTINKPTARKTDTKKVDSKKVSTSSPTKPHDIFWVQTASLTSRLYAEEARKTLQERNMKAEIFTKQTLAGLVHRVRVGPFSNKTEASYWLKNIKEMNGFEDSFVSKEHVN